MASTEERRTEVPVDLFRAGRRMLFISMVISGVLTFGIYCVLHFSALKMPPGIAIASAICFGLAIGLMLDMGMAVYHHAVAFAERFLYLQNRS